jgi:hypothetical protein
MLFLSSHHKVSLTFPSTFLFRLLFYYTFYLSLVNLIIEIKFEKICGLVYTYQLILIYYRLSYLPLGTVKFSGAESFF